MPRFVFLLILLLGGGCASSGGTTDRLLDRLLGQEALNPLILVSIDGFHPDYLDRGLTPTLQHLADNGVRARWMTPSFPSKTFPNHYTLVTGLVPDHHGIIENNMFDPALGQFSLQNREAIGDGRWWGGEPIWVAAHRHGLRTATLFWPGSEARIGGVRPDEWLHYDASMTDNARVDHVLEWLSRSPRKRPHFVTLYFDQIDKAGHAFGPESPEIDAALVAFDATLRRFLDRLDALALDDAVNLVIVSDHGMAYVPPEDEIVLEDIVEPGWVNIVSLSEISLFQPRSGHEAQAEAALLRPHAHMDCYRKTELPPQWRYGSHARIPAIVCQLQEGWRITRRETFNPWREQVKAANRGAHGFDPASPSMRALFVARGPSFRQGLLLEPFANVDVYPLLAELLGFEAPANDGNPATTAPMLRSAPSLLPQDQKSVQP
jgi:predicted AlkP superfamily pyrophosphatase or phosphodiesterase